MDEYFLKGQENDKNFFYQRIRKDLIEQGLSVPVGEGYLFTLDMIKCKWLDDDDSESFVVFIDGEWQSAYSIDFEDII